MVTRKYYSLVFTLFLFVITGSAMAGTSEQEANARKIDVMTANLYLGADIFRIVEAAQTPPSPENPFPIPVAVTEVFGIVQATNFPERAEAIADEIMKRRPHVIGLQEVSMYRTGPYDGIPVNAENIQYDFLALLMDALAARGLDYRVAGEVTNADVEAPMIVAPPPDLVLADLRLTDRDVILVRGDVETGTAFPFHYSINASFDLGGSNVEFTRGFVMVPVAVMGRSYLVVNTHLETRLESFLPDEQGRVFQFAQAAQLVGTVDYMNTNVFGDLPVVLVGDLNSDPMDDTVEVQEWARGYPLYIPADIEYLFPPYLVLAAAGFTDTWTLRTGKKDSGETCCHNEMLDNPDENFYERIDHIFFRDSNPSLVLGPVQSEIINDVQGDKTASNLWASDHGFVSASIKQKHLKQ